MILDYVKPKIWKIMPVNFVLDAQHYKDAYLPLYLIAMDSVKYDVLRLIICVVKKMFYKYYEKERNVYILKAATNICHFCPSVHWLYQMVMSEEKRNKKQNTRNANAQYKPFV